jgi:beta-lactamase class A
MLQQSDNLAANVLISNLGVREINESVRAFGATATRIVGLYTDKASAPGLATTSPSDLATLLGVLLSGIRGEPRASQLKLSPAECELLVDMLSSSAYNSMIRAGLPSGAQVSSKEGIISRFVGDAAIVDPLSPAPMIIVALADMAGSALRDLPLQRTTAARAIRRIAHESYSKLGSFAF